MLKENIYLGLGSNLGNREKFLQSAINQLQKSGKIELIKISAPYETEPVGFIEQDKYLNLAAEIKSSLTPDDLMTHLEEIESGIGKKAEFKNGPREIDIDILFYDNEVIQSDRLTIPHPGLNRREFALRPLLDLNPDLIEPTTDIPYSEYLKRIGGKKKVVRKNELDFNQNAR